MSFGSPVFEPIDRLLTRDQFRNGVFARDGHKCVVCGYQGKLDAHHILERRLWPDGGYYLSNGASVCEPCHLKAEQTVISCDELRILCGITDFKIPPHMYRDVVYDKWGNPIQDNGTRLRGELFDDESVQKVLAPVLHLFTNKVKYPRTYHLPHSPGVGKDDRIVDDFPQMFSGNDVVITEKMDGENTTMYSDYIHARSLEYSPHGSRDRVKALWANIAHDIPDGYRICGENLFAEHSIHYDDLASYFYVFSIWNEKNECLSWDETKEWAALFGFPTVPELYRGMWADWKAERGLTIPMFGLVDRIETGRAEGFVVRNSRSFHYKDFRYNVAKWVRANHVQHKDGHWSNRKIIPNQLGNK